MMPQEKNNILIIYKIIDLTIHLIMHSSGFSRDTEPFVFHTYVHIHTHTYVCVCICVCVYSCIFSKSVGGLCRMATQERVAIQAPEQSAIELGRADLQIKSKGSLLENSLLLRRDHSFVLFKPSADLMRLEWRESNLVYSTATSLNRNLTQTFSKKHLE